MIFSSPQNQRFSIVSSNIRPASKFRNTTRALRLNALWQLTKWKSNEETPKTAICKSRSAVAMIALIHFIPLVASITLIVFNLIEYAYNDEAPLSTSPLQFAAKMLEIFMQASITSIVLNYIRNAVTGKHSIPFGALIGPYRTTDVSYLWSLELAGALTSPSFIGWQRVLVTILLPSAVVLAALVGPSAAVLMIPRPIIKNEWSVLTFVNQSELVYPKIIGLEGTSIQAERDINETVSQIVNGLVAGLAAPIVDQSGPRSLTWGPIGVNNGTVDQDNNTFITTGVTIPTRISAFTALIGQLESKITAVQPYIQTQCWVREFQTVNDPKNTHVEFGPTQHDLNQMITYQDLLNDTLISGGENDTATWRLQLNGTNYSFLWHAAPEETTNHSVLVTFGITDSTFANWTTQSCTIDAYWAVASSNATGTSQKSTGIVNEAVPNVLARVTGSDLIRLHPGWAKRLTDLTMDYIFQDPVSNTMIFGESGGFEEASGAHVFQPATTFFTPVMVLALSAIPPLDGMMLDFISDEGTIGILEKNYDSLLNATYLDNQQYQSFVQYVAQQKLLEKFTQIIIPGHSTNWTDPASLATIEKRFYSQMYGYGTDGTAVMLSLIVLFIYVAAVITHLVHLIVTGTTATSWSSVTELFALALNSRRPENLKNTSVGIDTLETFRSPMNIRINDEDSAEIVFVNDVSKEQGCYRRIVPNERY